MCRLALILDSFDHAVNAILLHPVSVEESSSTWEKQSLSLFTQLLQGQEETRQMILAMQDELYKVSIEYTEIRIL